MEYRKRTPFFCLDVKTPKGTERILKKRIFDLSSITTKFASEEKLLEYLQESGYIENAKDCYIGGISNLVVVKRDREMKDLTEYEPFSDIILYAKSKEFLKNPNIFIYFLLSTTCYAAIGNMLESIRPFLIDQKKIYKFMKLDSLVDKFNLIINSIDRIFIIISEFEKDNFSNRKEYSTRLSKVLEDIIYKDGIHLCNRRFVKLLCIASTISFEKDFEDESEYSTDKGEDSASPLVDFSQEYYANGDLDGDFVYDEYDLSKYVKDHLPTFLKENKTLQDSKDSKIQDLNNALLDFLSTPCLETLEIFKKLLFGSAKKLDLSEDHLEILEVFFAQVEDKISYIESHQIKSSSNGFTF